MKTSTVPVETLLEGYDLPRCVKFKVGGIVCSAVRRKRKNFAGQFFKGEAGNVEIHEVDIKPGALVELLS